MNKQDFINYVFDRYGIEQNISETMLDIFADSLHDLIVAGYSIKLDEIGEFKTTPLFPNGLNAVKNNALDRLAHKNMVSFTPSKVLTEGFI